MSILQSHAGRDIGIVVQDDERAPHIRWAVGAYANRSDTLISLAEKLADRGLTMPATVRYPSDWSAQPPP